jgi:hypothetical protein
MNQVSPLTVTAKDGHKAIVQILLNHGADIDGRDTNCDCTPLESTIEGGHQKIAPFYLRRALVLVAILRPLAKPCCNQPS